MIVRGRSGIKERGGRDERLEEGGARLWLLLRSRGQDGGFGDRGEGRGRKSGRSVKGFVDILRGVFDGVEKGVEMINEGGAGFARNDDLLLQLQILLLFFLHLPLLICSAVTPLESLNALLSILKNRESQLVPNPPAPAIVLKELPVQRTRKARRHLDPQPVRKVLLPRVDGPRTPLLLLDLVPARQKGGEGWVAGRSEGRKSGERVFHRLRGRVGGCEAEVRHRFEVVRAGGGEGSGEGRSR